MAVTTSSSSGTESNCATLSLPRKSPCSRSVSAPRLVRFSDDRRPSSSTESHGRKRICLCSPSEHKGAFRCSLHRSQPREADRAAPSQPSVSFARRLALANSLVRIGVDEDRVRKLKSRPVNRSTLSPRRSRKVISLPSRLSAVSGVEDQSNSV